MNAIEMLRQATLTRNLDKDTFQQYAFWIKRIYGFLKIPASQWTGPDIERAMAWLNEERYSPTSRKLALCAVVFWFKHVLKRDLGQLNLPPMPKQRKTLKVVPTREEVARIISLMRGEFQLMAGLMYGAGTRVEETCMLRVQDIDFDRGEIRIMSGKGDKSRTPPLPQVMIPALKAYIDGPRRDLFNRDIAAGAGHVELPNRLDRKYRNASREYRWQFLFASRRVTNDGKRWYLTPEAVQNALREAVKLAQVTKRVTPHTLRHAFCTHALENGEEFETVRNWMGHTDANTTLIYAHTQHRGTSPMDFGRAIKPAHIPPQITFHN